MISKTLTRKTKQVFLLFFCVFVFGSLSVQAQIGKEVKGTIKDEKGQGMPGVNVVEKGTPNGVTTELDGKYEIKLTTANAVLEVTFLGYTTQTILVGNRTGVDVIMKEEISTLDQVVVLGFGAETRKADLSASVGTIQNLDAVKTRPVSSATDLLQGQIPGVTVLNQGGDPSAPAKIMIRGQGSRKEEQPLWVVDGVPGGPLNVNEIENIVVLKDAASAAIYGAYSGSSGVILVTTKKAKAGLPTISYEGTMGVSMATNLSQSLTIEQEREVRRQALAVEGNTLPTGWDPVKNPYIATDRTDWIDAIFREALFQRHNVSLNAGNESFANRLSLQYNNNEGVLVGTFNKSVALRYNGTFNLSKHIRISEDLHWQLDQKRGEVNTTNGYSGVILSALMMPRNAEAYYSDGTFGGTAPKDPAYEAKYGSNFADIHGDVINPLRTLVGDTQFKHPSSVTSSTFFEILQPIPGLKFTSRFTYKQEDYFSKRFEPRAPEPGKPNMNNRLEYAVNRFTKWETENTLNFDRTFNRHTIGALISTTANEQRKREVQTLAKGFADETEDKQYYVYATNFLNSSDYYLDPDSNVSFVGRLAYSWNNRYFVTGSFRRDYAGRLPKGQKYGDFPALTGAWKISEEGFMPKIDFLNLLKLRASWGRIGNISTVNYAYGYPVLGTGRNPGDIGTVDVGGQVGASNSVLSLLAYPYYGYNKNLTWETSETTNFGVDIDLFSNKLSVSAEYFMKRTFDLIKEQDYGWPSYIGVKPKLINEGEIRNSGFEFTVGWNGNIGQVSYYVSGNLATLKNRVYDIGAVTESGEKPVWTDGDDYRGVLKPYRTREGGPINSYWLVQSDGLFQTDEEASAYVNSKGKRIQPNAKAGDIRFIDQDGDGSITDNDRVYMGAYYPKITYSILGGFSYKNFSFNISFQGVGGSKAFNASKYTTLNEAAGNFNRWNKILDAFPNGGEIPRLTSKDPNGNFTTNSDWYLENSSYMRIKNINVGYSLDKLLHKLSPALESRKSSLMFSISIDNFYTFTKYTGIDPEVGGMGLDALRYPVPRVFSFGIKLTY